MDCTSSKWYIMLVIIFVNAENLKLNANEIAGVRAGSAAYRRYLRKNLQVSGCSPDDITSHCSQSSNYDECAREFCNRCILQASALNPFAYYCYWMMSCICTVTTCQDLSQIECY